jgi:hypothetical protein
MVRQQCTRCGFQTQTSACENCGSAALDVVGAAQDVSTDAVPLGGADLLNAPMGHARWDPSPQPLGENPALP